MNDSYQQSSNIERYSPTPSTNSGWPWTEQGQLLPQRMPNGSRWPRISIVTPSYNQGQFLEEAIRSILLQGYPNLEYILIDGNSNDNSIEIIKKYEQYFSYWVSEPDKGPTDAISKGWQRASGDILAYLNSDDGYLPNALATIALAFQQNQGVRIICGNELKINKEGFIVGKSDIKEVNYLSLLNLNFIPQPATFIKREVLELSGSIDSKIKYIFDFELWLRVSRSEPVQCIPNLLAFTRLHKNTITLTRRPEIGRELVSVIEREIINHPSLTELEAQQILFKVNHLAMSLHLEGKKNIEAAKYALEAVCLAPSLSLKLYIIKQFFKDLVSSSTQPPKDRDSSSETKPLIHWSTSLELRETGK